MSPLLVVGLGLAGGFLLAAGLHQAVESFRALLEQAADDDALDGLDDDVPLFPLTTIIFPPHGRAS